MIRSKRKNDRAKNLARTQLMSLKKLGDSDIKKLEGKK